MKRVSKSTLKNIQRLTRYINAQNKPKLFLQSVLVESARRKPSFDDFTYPHKKSQVGVS